MFDFARTTTTAARVHTNSGVPNKAAYLITDGTAAEPGGAFLGRAFAGHRPGRTRDALLGRPCRCSPPGSDFVDLARRPGRPA